MGIKAEYDKNITGKGHVWLDLPLGQGVSISLNTAKRFAAELEKAIKNCEADK